MVSKEWQWKINVFTDNFLRLSNVGLLPKSKCICLGARTGQEVVALNNIGYNALGIDIVPYEKANVFLGDIHNSNMKIIHLILLLQIYLTILFILINFVSETERVLKPGGLALYFNYKSIFNQMTKMKMIYIVEIT